MEIIRVSIATNDALPAECTSAYYGHFTTISVKLCMDINPTWQTRDPPPHYSYTKWEDLWEICHGNYALINILKCIRAANDMKMSV